MRGLRPLLTGLLLVPTALGAAVNDPIVFVSRQIPTEGSIYWDQARGMAGVGAQSRFINASPGFLQIRETNGTIRTLIDGANPTAGSLNLIDVNAPDVSYDGTTIVFAGLPNGSHSRNPVGNPGAWRLYSIRADGTGLRQITTTQAPVSAPAGYALAGNYPHDDTDPVWLPDGRIAFSSTRWGSFGHYSGARASNLFVVNADGTNLHRITAERNGADRPLIDPVTGKIVYSRWWRNHRFATDDMTTLVNPAGGFFRKDGLTSDRNDHVGGPDGLWRNAWQIATINPDGTGLAMWGGAFRNEMANHMYGGAFTPAGDLIANFFPMFNMTEAAGFGGLRRYARGANSYTPVMGITVTNTDYVKKTPPESFGILVGTYASEPEVMPDNTLVVSWTADINQDYGLYTANLDGTGRALLYDNPGTAELRARAVRVRPLPPILNDTITQVPSLVPPAASGPYDVDGTFVFDALNVYFNAPVDTDIVSAPPVGSAATIKFFIDHQRSSPGSFPSRDWPVLLGELPVNPDGSVKDSRAPANVPLFEQLRDSAGRTPRTRGANGLTGAAHVTGMNFGRPGAVARCVGCHAGHTMIPMPATDEEAKWTNLAPGAALSFSSSRDAAQDNGLTDRRVQKGENWRTWTSANGQFTGQWAKLTFPAKIVVRNVRLYNLKAGAEAGSTIQVNAATVRLYSDEAGTVEVASQTVGALSVNGTDVFFSSVTARVVKVDIDNVTGNFFGARVATLGEVEVIARGDEVAAAPQLAEFRLGEAFTYPNPVVSRNNVTFHVEATGADEIVLRVYDDAGAKIYQAAVEDPVPINGVPSFEHAWDISSIAAGTYRWTVTARRGDETIQSVRKLAIVK